MQRRVIGADCGRDVRSLRKCFSVGRGLPTFRPAGAGAHLSLAVDLPARDGCDWPAHASAARYRPGVSPVSRRNIDVKWLWSQSPAAGPQRDVTALQAIFLDGPIVALLRATNIGQHVADPMIVARPNHLTRGAAEDTDGHQPPGSALLFADELSPLRTDSLPVVSKIYWPENADDAIMDAP